MQQEGNNEQQPAADQKNGDVEMQLPDVQVQAPDKPASLMGTIQLDEAGAEELKAAAQQMADDQPTTFEQTKDPVPIPQVQIDLGPLAQSIDVNQV